MLLCLPALCRAYDKYTPSDGLLKIPHINVGSLTYSVEMQDQGGFVFQVVKSGLTDSVFTTVDTYDPESGVLEIPDVSVGTENFKVKLIHQGSLVFSLAFAEEVDTTLNNFKKKVVSSGLGFPYELTYGPDDNLWVTERLGNVARVDLGHQGWQTLLTLSDVYINSKQDGLLGMALHPNLFQNTGEDYVYIAYTYSADMTDLGRRLKIVRYRYDQKSQYLVSPVVLISGLKASSDHNSGRLIFGPDNKLYYSIGDQGANQLAHKCNEIMAQRLPTRAEVDSQDWSSYQGKILRLNLDGSIPSDNPFIHGVKSHIYSYGHRNPQGITFVDGKLYSAEHGSKTDDEVNLILAGSNYGWPHVAGYQDDQGYEYCNWSSAENCSSLVYDVNSCPATAEVQSESSWFDINFVPPLKTFYTVKSDFDFQNPPGDCATPSVCWPTIAPSSIDHYNPAITSIPGWNNSLLMTSLKKGEIYRIKVAEDGSLSDRDSSLLYTQNRYRDIALHPKAKKFFVITDVAGQTTAASGGSTAVMENPGEILEFTYIE